MMIKNKTIFHRFRTVLPQVIATVLPTCLMLDIGFSVSFPTIVISALTGLNAAVNPNEVLTLTAVQASYLGSTSYLSKLFGSGSSGWISESIGRRNTMIIVNIPQAISWYLFYKSTTLTQIFIANTMMGYGAGLMKAPSLNYVGEISEASLRGTLVSVVSISTMAGLLIAFVLGTLIEWRSVALVCLFIRVAVSIAFFLIPESPSFLLSKGRDEAAMKSLQWLRGWVPEKVVQDEFNTIKQFKMASNACSACEKAKIKCQHPPPTLLQNLKQLFRKRTLKPFLIVMICSCTGFHSGTHHLLPFIVQILKAYRSPMSPNLATVAIGSIAIIGTIVCVLTVKLIGKRRLFLFSLAATVVINCWLGFYGFTNLPPNLKSFDHKGPSDDSKNGTIAPFVLIIALQFFTTVIVSLPFILLSEIYPTKTRSLITGITTAILNVYVFIVSKTFYNLENWIYLPGAMLFYAGCGAIGFILNYFILPDTEGCTLEDIETHFSDNQKKLTDRNIVHHYNTKL